jgi:mannitol/fructose-specific phosphotransferase system IIA component (Ntr-type)
MNLSDYLHEECVQCNVQAADKAAVLRIIAQAAERCPQLQQISEDTIFQGLSDREELGSTGFGDGIAIPHCAIESLSEFVVGMLVVPDGVDFDSIDGQKTKLFMFILAPTNQRNEHIQVLSRISSVLRFPLNVQEILTAQTPAAARENFLRHLSVEAETPVKKEYSHLTVVVQDEAAFNDLLTMLTDIPNSFVSVVESNNASKYLHALPLFSSFWNEDRQGFQRIILAVVNKSLANEAIRRVKMIMEETGKQDGVLLFTQPISYMTGSLNLS